MSTFLKVIVIRDAQQIAQLNKKEEGGKKCFFLVFREIESF